MIEFEVVWNGGELLPPRAEQSSLADIVRYGRPGDAPDAGPHYGPGGTWAWSVKRWKSADFRRRVQTLAELGCSQREIGRRLAVSQKQVFMALRTTEPPR